MIFDEVAEAKKILEDKNLDFFDPTKIGILAKYFSYTGKSKKDIRSSLIDFCNSQRYIKYDSRDEETINKAIDNLKKYTIRIPVTCVITQDELDEIESIGDFKSERVFFVMICLAKYFTVTNTSKNKKEYSDEKLIFWRSMPELFKLARYSENFVNRNLIIGNIERLGYITTVPNKDRTKNHIFINTYYEESEPVIYFNNPEKVYKLYNAYKSEKLFRCTVCGNSIVKNSNRQVMCEKCAYDRKLSLNSDYKVKTRMKLEKYRKPL